jgi:dipeptidyl aminopeptidase/acylaminoacyl peptidase
VVGRRSRLLPADQPGPTVQRTGVPRPRRIHAGLDRHTGPRHPRRRRLSRRRAVGLGAQRGRVHPLVRPRPRSGPHHRRAAARRGRQTRRPRRHSIALTANGSRLVCLLSRATRPTELHLLDLDAPGGAHTERLTHCGDAVPGGTEPDIVRIPSTDGVTVSALLFRPPHADADAPAPAVVAIHGGPEDQEIPHWEWTSGLYQYLLHHGIGVLAPNIRGSTGYGKTHQRLIYRSWGDGDLRDIAACVGFCRGTDWIDAGRLGIYGGFAALSSLSRLADSWAAGVDVFGPSDLPAFARTVPPHWRRRVREWIGDPDEDADMLAERSPLTYADQIRAPLLTVQGAHDTRVVKPAADRLVTRLRELGREVEYLVLPDDGHGFGTRKTYAAVMSACAVWFLRHLR